MRHSEVVVLGAAAITAAALVALALAVGPTGDDAADVTTLADAVAAGDVDAAARLIDDGADPDEPRVHGFTPLMRAAIRDDAAMVDLLLDAGADPGATEPGGATAVLVAAAADSAGAVAALIEAGADPTVRAANGMDALGHAAASGSTRVLSLLAAGGADLDARSGVITQGHGYPPDRGSTPLGIAVWNGEPAAVETLLDLGADVDRRSDAGHTPLLLAVFADASAATVALLLDHGADPTITASCTTRCAFAGGGAVAWARHLDRDRLVPLLDAGAAPGAG